MMLRSNSPTLVALLLAVLPHPAPGQGLAAAQAEASRCEDQIASIKRDVIGKYEDALADLQAQFQKAADLEGALAVREERERVARESVLSEEQFVKEPNALHALQQQHVTKMRELIGGAVTAALPRLIELKRQLTIAGKLDEAVEVRAAIDQLQNDHVPLAKPAADEVVTADTLLTAYAADRTRADKIYKGQKILIRGLVGGFRASPSDSGQFLIYLARTNGGSGWVQCELDGRVMRAREEKQFNTKVLTISNRRGDVLTRVQTGQNLELRGICEGFEEVVVLTKCEVPG